MLSQARGAGAEDPGHWPSAGREGRPDRTREKQGQEVPYRHTATLPPHPLRSRRSAPTLGARPHRPTWPPHAQLKGGDQQPFPTSSPGLVARGARGARVRGRAIEESARLKSKEGSSRGGKHEDSGPGPSAHAQQQSARRSGSRWLRFRYGGYLGLLALAQRSCAFPPPPLRIRLAI